MLTAEKYHQNAHEQREHARVWLTKTSIGHVLSLYPLSSHSTDEAKVGQQNVDPVENTKDSRDVHKVFKDLCSRFRCVHVAQHNEKTGHNDSLPRDAFEIGTSKYFGSLAIV